MTTKTGLSPRRGGVIKGHDLLHEQISRYVQNLIKTENLQPGDRLISEREIASMFKSSNRPVRQAIQPLIDQGILERIHGKGTFIRQPMERPVKTGKIGVLFHHSTTGIFKSSFYAPILSGIERQAQLHNQFLVMGSLGQEQDPAALLHRLDHDVDGYILLDYQPVSGSGLDELLRQTGQPVVVLNYEEPLADLDTVVFGSYEGICRMVNFLMELGHSRMAYVNSQLSDHPNYRNRQRAFQNTVGQAAGATLAPVWSIENLEADLAVFRQLLNGPQAPTALVCASDRIALQVYALAAQIGVRIPADLTVTGFDDVSECLQAAPPLTTVHTSLEDMGMLGAKRLIEKIAEAERGVTSHVRMVLPGSIIERGSHRNLNEPNTLITLTQGAGYVEKRFAGGSGQFGHSGNGF